MPEAFSLARRLRAGETVFTAWCAAASPIAIETIARAGYEAAILDSQHGLWDMASLIAGIGAVHHAGSAPGVRVPLNDFALVSRALDCGAEAIIAPMINTAAEARAFAAAAKYPPLGERSWGPLRAMPLQGRTVSADYLREANDGTLTLAMIETRIALENVAAIAATPGIDALFVGPYDLSTAERGRRAGYRRAAGRQGDRRHRRRGPQGRQDPWYLLPRSAARARHGEARLPLHRRRQRPRPAPGRRSGATQGAEGLAAAISESHERRSCRWH
ncbi:MAG TPA: aldolase/citrate lyase family protein [Beijerinckiaceae bacterium]|jgi:2-keto-3-deoxy-L-rhamnonate aldolase RhmA|nr:aldolase/citrate lyase family protein [Beijerinckiaceae bacterium]